MQLASRQAFRKADRKTVRKARHASECQGLEQIPNIGAAMADELRRIGVAQPGQLIEADALDLYRRMGEARGARVDPCVLDTLLAATDFMRGAGPAPWWQYTVARKARYGQVLDGGGMRRGQRGGAMKAAGPG